MTLLPHKRPEKWFRENIKMNNPWIHSWWCLRCWPQILRLRYDKLSVFHASISLTYSSRSLHPREIHSFFLFLPENQLSTGCFPFPAAFVYCVSHSSLSEEGRTDGLQMHLEVMEDLIRVHLISNSKGAEKHSRIGLLKVLSLSANAVNCQSYGHFWHVTAAVKICS